MPLIFLRSLIFNVLFYLCLVLWIIVALPTFVMPRWAIMTIAKCWARSSIWLMRVVCNIRVEYRGLEKIPGGPLIVALILGKLRRTGGMNWTIPLSANLVIRNLGLTLFLAQVWMASGPKFAATVAQTGLTMLGLGALVVGPTDRPIANAR